MRCWSAGSGVEARSRQGLERDGSRSSARRSRPACQLLGAPSGPARQQQCQWQRCGRSAVRSHKTSGLTCLRTLRARCATLTPCGCQWTTAVQVQMQAHQCTVHKHKRLMQLPHQQLRQQQRQQQQQLQAAQAAAACTVTCGRPTSCCSWSLGAPWQPLHPRSWLLTLTGQGWRALRDTHPSLATGCGGRLGCSQASCWITHTTWRC
mmetsp:Transcript_20667/g.52473  ORF Transcript_20667/g.52473 Transcript_20667/m.52473 type:complete len:207 (+) Transcript_20667:1339-1959(+)